MVETQVKVAMVVHHSRVSTAELRAAMLGAHMFVDDGEHGANWNHRRALEWAANQPSRVIVMEDDALPHRDFVQLASRWLSYYPDALVSFYLGTGRPPQYQLEIATRLIAADKTHATHIVMNRLIHGVCYSVPQKHIQRVLDKWNYTKAADYAVGDAYGGPVIYPCYSLVDHADGEPVEPPRDGQPRIERRKAWRLHE